MPTLGKPLTVLLWNIITQRKPLLLLQRFSLKVAPKQVVFTWCCCNACPHLSTQLKSECLKSAETTWFGDVKSVSNYFLSVCNPMKAIAAAFRIHPCSAVQCAGWVLPCCPSPAPFIIRIYINGGHHDGAVARGFPCNDGSSFQQSVLTAILRCNFSTSPR